VLAVGAGLAAAGVLLGAFGAHALAHLPAKPLGWWHTATQYLFVAAFGTMLAGLAQPDRPFRRSPALALLVGLLLFSGSLYAMALGAPRALGMVTPVGGVSLVAGFVWLGLSAARPRP
jgi:uncharacterized membrane protein YgdD (TMEM256/DUF423 family)